METLMYHEQNEYYQMPDLLLTPRGIQINLPAGAYMFLPQRAVRIDANVNTVEQFATRLTPADRVNFSRAVGQRSWFANLYRYRKVRLSNRIFQLN